MTQAPLTATQLSPQAPAIPPADRGKLVAQYLPYVRHIAGKVKRTLAKQIEYDDLVEYGMVGLFEAADRFDASQGANFMTFAYYRVRGAIYDGLRNMGWLSRAAYARARLAEQQNDFLGEVAQAPLGREEGGTDAPRVAAKSGYEQQVTELAHAVTGLATIYITSLDGALAAKLEDDQALPEAQVSLAEARQLVRTTLKKLSKQERELLEMYYYDNMSLQEVGDKLGLSKSWASRLHARAIEKLHRLLEEPLGDG